METRLTLRPGVPGTKSLLARYGERLICVRYLYASVIGWSPDEHCAGAHPTYIAA